jgi:hypothetical protein
MAAWDITTAGAAFEFETTLMQFPTIPIAVDANHFFASYAGSGSDGFVSVFTVNTTTWAVTEAGTLEHDTQNQQYSAAVQIDTNHFAVFYLGSATTLDGFVQTFTVNTSTWAVSTAAARFLFDTDVGSYNSAVMIDANHIINFWNGAASDGFVQTFTVNTTTWAVTTAGASFEFDTQTNLYNSAFRVDTNHFINFWGGLDSDGYVQVFTVNTSTWAVTTAAASLEYDTQNGTIPSTYKIDTNHFINFWRATDTDGAVQVFEVNTTTWAVTTASALLEFDTQEYNLNGSTTQIDSNHFLHVWAGPDTAAGSAYDGFAQVFEVNTTTWAVTTAGAPFEFDTTQGEYNAISAAIAGFPDKFLHLFSGSGDDGFAQVLSVQVPPTVVLNTPADAATGVSVTPTLEFTGTDLNVDSVRYEVQVDTVNTFDSQTQSTINVVVEAWGGGGRGRVGSGASGGGGGGGGAYSRADDIAVDDGVGYTVTVGTGGDTAEEAGGDSGFDDNSELLAKGGASGTASTTGASGGLAASGVGDTKFNGGTGGNGDTSAGGGGGGGAGTTAVGGTGSNGNVGTGGAGGTGGAVGGGNGGAGSTADNAAAGSTIGGGGGGSDDSTDPNGGNGARGEVRVKALLGLVESATGGTHTTDSTYDIWTFTSNGTWTPTLAGTSLINAVSGTDSGFANTVSGGDTDPFNSGEKADYDVQITLSNSTVYYWRVRGIDPAGSNTYGAWSSTRSFTTAAGGGTTRRYSLTTLGVG